MTIGLSPEHVALAESVTSFLTKKAVRAHARQLLDAEVESRPAWWTEAARHGWLGLHVPEMFGGGGFTLFETAIVSEQFGRAMAPGPFAPTVIASSALTQLGAASAGSPIVRALVDGSATAALALDGRVEFSDGLLTGTVEAALGGAVAEYLLLNFNRDAYLLDLRGAGVSRNVPENLDPTRRCAEVQLESAPALIFPGAADLVRDISSVILGAEAAGVARECTEAAAGYAVVREQFGRAIGTFQAVKHHCADMLVATELATAAVWDAARAASAPAGERSLAAAYAASLAGPAADLCANLSVQVHGGIGFTWEHDAHLYLRRAAVLKTLLDPDRSAARALGYARAGVTRRQAVDLPPEAEAVRAEVRAFITEYAGLSEVERADALLDTGYALPHWPRPWGRAAGPLEQLVIEDEFSAAGIARPRYGITGWVIQTLVQHGSAEQIARWVGPALRRELVWCQLFSEPNAGSDAAGVRTSAVPTEGGWLVNGQKVWTTGAHTAAFGLATIRTDPSAAKHRGITTMVIDMNGPGVTVRPLRTMAGTSEFNEVFFDDVFVPKTDVVGEPNAGWAVARATMGNESVSIGAGQTRMFVPPAEFIEPFDAHPERLTGGAPRLGHYLARAQAVALLNLRSAQRAVSSDRGGIEGLIAKLELSELGHEATHIRAALDGYNGVYRGSASADLQLQHRGLSIAGGTSEIKRNQIGEYLGLPRDPLTR